MNNISFNLPELLIDIKKKTNLATQVRVSGMGLNSFIHSFLPDKQESGDLNEDTGPIPRSCFVVVYLG